MALPQQKRKKTKLPGSTSVMVKAEDISPEMLDAIEKLLDGMRVTADQVVNDLLDIPEVSKVVKTIRAEAGREGSIPKWAKEAGVTLAQWEESQEYIRKIKAINAKAREEMDRAREEYVSKCAVLRQEAEKKRPVLHGDVARIVDAAFITWDDVPVSRRARMVLESKDDSDDERSLKKGNLLSAYRGECVRRAPSP